MIASPSNHRSGGTYSFIDAGSPIPAMPGWLHDQVCRSRTPRATHDPIHVGEAIDGLVRAAILNEAAPVRQAPDGGRNATLNRAAFSLGQIVATGIVDADTVRLALQRRREVSSSRWWRCAISRPASMVRATIGETSTVAMT